jgi:hypothetical protein
MTPPLEFLAILVGVSFVGLGVYGAAPAVLTWRRSREVRPLGVFNVSEAFPLLRQDLETIAPEPATHPAPTPAPAVEPVPSGLLSEVDLLHQEVDGLRREIGSLRLSQRRRTRPLQPAAALPAALRRQLVVVRQMRRRRGLAVAATLGAAHGLPRRIA